MRLQCAAFGAVCGDAVLMHGARTVVIAGGIVPRFIPFLRSSAFRERFLAKGRFRPWLERVPTWVILAPHAALIGASAALDRAIEVGFTSLAEPEAL